MKTLLKLPTLALIMALGVTAALPTDASAMRRSDNAVPEQRLKLKAEWAQARNAGGYGNPVSAFIGLLNGETPPNAIQPVINDPEPETIFDNFGNWFRSDD